MLKHGVHFEHHDEAYEFSDEVEAWVEEGFRKEVALVESQAGSDSRLTMVRPGEWQMARGTEDSYDTLGYFVYRLYAGTTDPAGNKRSETDPHFTLCSTQAQRLTGGDATKPHGLYTTLAEAAQAGDDLLASINPGRLRSVNPAITDFNVEMWVGRVPARLRQGAGPKP